MIEPERLHVLETLAEELLKAEPAEDIIALNMKKAGLVDSKDPVDRINKVLLALHFSENEKAVTE